jgi:hypothetical protein
MQSDPADRLKSLQESKVPIRVSVRGERAHRSRRLSPEKDVPALC